MFLTSIFLWTVLHIVLADNVTTSPCASGFWYSNRDKPINIAESCNEKSPCFSKCCPANHILVLNESENNLLCVATKNLTLNLSNLDDYSEIEFYKSNIDQKIVKTTKKVEQFIQIYSENFHDDLCFANIAYYFTPPWYKIYLLENGSSVLRNLNSYRQWLGDLQPGEFCVERQILLRNGTISQPEWVVRMSTTGGGEQEPTHKTAVLTSGLLVSSVFLALVLVVYALLPQLRNMAGIIQMAYFATLIAAFVSRSAQVIAPEIRRLPKMLCICLGLMANYTFVANFTWMNVMSFDIWWSMRGFRKMRPIHRRGVMIKLAWYALYGWGMPLGLVVFMIIVENLDLTHMPNFIKPHYSNPQTCFMEPGEMLVYFDGPILLATCVNIAFFLMTAYNVWRIRRGVAQHSAGDSRTNKKDETRFGIYLKLWLVMGINWILEIISTLCAPESVGWYATDVFNSLTGLIIFIIFICKKNVIVLLCKRLSIGHELVRKWQPKDSKYTESSGLSGRDSTRKMKDSVTDTSDVYEHHKSIKK